MDKNTPSAIAARLSEAQRKALLAFSDTSDGYPGHYAKATELGVRGTVLMSMYGLGGVDPETLELGPILITDDYTREGRHYSIEPLGLEVRAVLIEQAQQSLAA